jgi:hypothetical protein
MVLLLGAVVYFSRITLIVIAGAYSLHGVVLYIVRFARRRLASRTA